MTKIPPSGRQECRGFSLIELLTVIAIIVVLLALSVPAMNSVLSGMKLNHSGQQIADQIMLGRQSALTQNRNVEVRFVRFPDPVAPSYRGMQLWIVDEAGTNRTPISRMISLPEGVIFTSNSTYSPLIFGSGSTISGEGDFGSRGTCQYAGFRFRANGQTDIPTASGTNAANYITLQNSTDASSPPKNFFTIEINPLTGKVAVLRP